MKDISVAEEKKEPEVPPSQVPDDPAILGVSLINSYLPFSMMKYSGCKHRPVPRAQNHVDISVAFLLIYYLASCSCQLGCSQLMNV